MPRGGRSLAKKHLGLFFVALFFVASATGCTTIDPGADFSLPNIVFDPNYFYCVVEPQIIFQYTCGGTGTSGSCHYNASAVSGMVLTEHTPIDCGGDGGSAPVNPTDVGAGTPAAANYASASLEMNTNYQAAQFYLRPTQLVSHPEALFPPDPNSTPVEIIATWASMQ